jgi:hypothetical protein
MRFTESEQVRQRWLVLQNVKLESPRVHRGALVNQWGMAISRR